MTNHWQSLEELLRKIFDTKSQSVRPSVGNILAWSLKPRDIWFSIFFIVVPGEKLCYTRLPKPSLPHPPTWHAYSLPPLSVPISAQGQYPSSSTHTPLQHPKSPPIPIHPRCLYSKKPYYKNLKKPEVWKNPGKKPKNPKNPGFFGFFQNFEKTANPAIHFRPMKLVKATKTVGSMEFPFVFIALTRKKIIMNRLRCSCMTSSTQTFSLVKNILDCIILSLSLYNDINFSPSSA